MTTFKPLGLSADLWHPDIARSWVAQPPTGLDHGAHPVTFAAFKEIPWLLFGLAKAGQSQVNTRTPYLDNDLVALAFRTPAALVKSPAPAMRALRDSVEGLGSIPTDRGLFPASHLMSSLSSLWYRGTFKVGYLLNEGTPNWLAPLESLLSRFGAQQAVVGSHRYLFYPRWFRRELADYLRERLTDAQAVRRGPWNSQFVSTLVEDHIEGRTNYVREINAVLTYMAIDRLLLRRSAATEAVAGTR